MNTTMMRRFVSTATLPEDPALQEQLRRKLDEYRFRLKVPLYDHAETAYKIAALERLLGDGSVEAAVLAKQLAAAQGSQFDHEVFFSAFAVIESYCRDGGKTTFGGTGLRTTVG